MFFRRSKPSITSLVAFGLILSPVVYVLSYAPAFRFMVDTGGPYVVREDWQDLYRPVEWLTDNTPLREPLLFWAGLWGEEVEDDFRMRSDMRRQGVDPYLFDNLFETFW